MAKLVRSSYYYPFQDTIDEREPTALEEEFTMMGNMIIL